MYLTVCVASALTQSALWGICKDVRINLGGWIEDVGVDEGRVPPFRGGYKVFGPHSSPEFSAETALINS